MNFESECGFQLRLFCWCRSWAVLSPYVLLIIRRELFIVAVRLACVFSRGDLLQ